MKQSPIAFYRRLSPAAKTALWFTLCNFLQRGTALITTPVFTRLLTTKEYGLCSIYFTWFDLFVLLSSLKLPYEGLNNGLIRYEEDKDRYASSIMGLICVLTALCGLVYLPLRSWMDRVTGLGSFLMPVLLVHLLLSPALNIWTNRERFEFRYRLPVIVTLLCTLLSPAISIAAVLNTPFRAEARILGTVVVQCLVGLWAMTVLFSRGKTFYHGEYWRFAVGFNLPLLFYYLSQLVLNQSDRLMIAFYQGEGKAGIYSVAYTAATLTYLIVSAINGALNPWMYQKLKAGQEKEIGGVVLSLLTVIGTVTVAMTAFAPDLVSLLATPDYQEAVWIIPPVSASVFFIFFYMILANIEMYFGENRMISLVSIAAAGANLLLNALFIPRFGYLAAGWTTLVCYVLLTGFHFLLMKRALRLHMDGKRLFPEHLMLLVALIVVLMSFAMLWTYRLGWLRFGVLALIGVTALIQRKRLLQVWKHIKK